MFFFHATKERAVHSIVLPLNNLLGASYETVKNKLLGTEYDFILSNFVNFDTFLNQLNREIYDSTLEYATSISNKIQLLIILMNVIIFCLVALQCFNYYHFLSDLKKIYNLMTMCTINSTENDLQNYQNLLQKIKNNSSFLFTYSFNIREKFDKVISSFLSQNTSNQQNSKSGSRKRNKIYVQINRQHLSFIRFLVNTIVPYLCFIIYTILAYENSVTYFANFKPAIEYYQKFCQSSKYVPSMVTLKMTLIYYHGVPSYPYQEQFLRQYIQTYEDSLADLI